ncbi:MAG: type II toxin-antitoxin system HicA family toxin [Verrucomicrobiae bacterium]|nr:type II toxin-antitoxin system HicA family toxin [Verrucomicrobiae bacterium]
MPKPISWREMVRRPRSLGWSGPHPGGRHPVMVKGNMRLTLPNPHRGDVDWSLMKRILRVADVSPDEWEKLR